MATTLNIVEIQDLPAAAGVNGVDLMVISQGGITKKLLISQLLSSVTGITSLNGLTGATQTFANGTSGLSPAFSSVGTTHTLNIPLASVSSVTAGLISKTDYDNFNAASGLVTTSRTANTVFAAPDGVAGAPSFRALTATDIPNLDAAKITTGTFADARIPNLDAAKITTGTFAIARGGTGTSTAFTQGSVVFAGASGVYSQDNANLFWDDSNNYLGVGVSTSLDANVTIKGYGTGNTKNLTIVNSSSGKILRSTNDGYLYVGNNSSDGVWIGSSSQSNFVPSTTETGQNNLVFSTALGNVAGHGFIFTNSGFTFSPPTGMASVMAFGDVEFQVTSGTGDFTSYNINPNINQTLTSSGTVRGIYYNPTVTSITGVHRAIETVVGEVLIGSTSGKLNIGNQTQFISTGDFGFSGVSPSPAQTGWTITNPTTLRSIDVAAATFGDVREVLGTLLQDLIDKGIILP